MTDSAFTQSQLATPVTVPNGGTGAATLTGILKGNGTSAVTTASSVTDYQTPLTISTGLTNTSGTVTDNLATGVSGGQTATGGTGASESLTLRSTTNATKGKILVGSNMGIIEATGYIGSGTQTPTAPFHATISSSTVPALRLNQGTLGGLYSTALLMDMGVNGQDSGGSPFAVGTMYDVIANGTRVSDLAGTQYAGIPTGVGECFPIGVAWVLMNDMTWQRLEHCHAGAGVMSMHEPSGMLVPNVVEKLESHLPMGKRDLLVFNRHSVPITYGHKVRFGNRFGQQGYKQAGHLGLGEYFITRENKKLPVWEVKHIEGDPHGESLFNLKMGGTLKNYIIRITDPIYGVDTGLLIHNKCPGIYKFDPSISAQHVDAGKLFDTTIYHGIDSTDKQIEQLRPLNYITNKYLMRENEPEIGHYKMSKTSILNYAGDQLIGTSRYRGVDGVLDTEWGYEAFHEWEPILDGTTRTVFRIEPDGGFYEWKGDDSWLTS